MRYRKRHGTASSLEGNFRSPQRWDAPPLVTEPNLDMHDAEVVENAVCALPITYHAVLRFTYVDWLLPVGIARYTHRLTGVEMHPYRDLPGIMDRAISALAEQLELPAVVRKQRATNKILRIRAQLAIDKQDDAA